MTNKRILYGDDKEMNGKALARALRGIGFEVDLAINPQEFLAKARNGNYRALITDLEYTDGGREGYEVLKQIRNLPGLKMLFSGVAGFEYEAEAYECGADFAVLKKDQSRLLEILDKELGGKENGN